MIVLVLWPSEDQEKLKLFYNIFGKRVGFQNGGWSCSTLRKKPLTKK